jgi:hypothetical protein
LLKEIKETKAQATASVQNDMRLDFSSLIYQVTTPLYYFYRGVVLCSNPDCAVR